MNFHEETYWQVQDYINGKLKGNALIEFENKISQDINLPNEIALQRLANKLILENRLSSASQVSLNTIESFKISQLRNRIIAAGISAIVSIGILSYIFQKENVQSENVITTGEKLSVQQNPDPMVSPKLKQTITNPKTAVKTVEKDLQSISRILPAMVDSAQKSSDKNQDLLSENTKQEISDTQQIQKQSLVINNCSDINIKGNISVKSSCYNEANGHIYANRFEGGVSPYTYKVFSKVDHYIPHDNLSGGVYNVIIFDHSNCSTVYSNITVKEISCLETEKSFNPYIGEILELGERDLEGSFIVYSKGGDIHYSKDFSKNENLQWNGVANNGVTETGYYIYTIKYKDGTSVQGEVTVIR